MSAIARLLFLAALSIPCCIVHSSNMRRIVGGAMVPENEQVPYQVSLQFQTKRGIRHYCGGSIIAPNRILTAAHCCKDMNVTLITVLAGVRNLDDRHGFRSKALKCAAHPDYQMLVTSDIAVLSIDPPLKYNSLTIAPISVIGKEFVPGNVSVTITGWGRMFPIPLNFIQSLTIPNTMRRINYHTITNKKCYEMGKTRVTDTEICAHGLFKGVCSGDSGGPLVMKSSKGLHQVGIVSYGWIICGLSIAPDVYTRVSTFSDWIQEQLKK
ncbi:chymotrypsin-1-like [Scaptodrosophila lebanonensis]|uniref:trypsin n=1 Tax=Drosophila lebanonensis TaxID=7225 RepID=A0A6J2TGQ6_DROLE|nr:chymotrypsin-1-like [Scaptodrosophila lebanonensis]